MINLKLAFAGLSALLLPTTAATTLATSNETQSVKLNGKQKLLYQYNGQVFEDVDDVLKNFLLDNPDFMSFINVLGDVEAAKVDFDRGILNKDLLPDYDLNKVKPVYKKPSGEYTSDFDEAKSAMVNPAFARTMLTDNFGSYFALHEKQSAIDSFRAKIMTGDIGVINLDSFNGLSYNYNPLSETDFKQLKSNTEKQILNLPDQVTQNNDYSHEWYKDGKTVKSFNDFFEGSEEQLTQLLNISYERYYEMRNIYSPINGYDFSNYNRVAKDIAGKNIYAINNDSVTNYLPDINSNNFDLGEAKLVATSEDVLTYRQDLEIKKNNKKEKQTQFLNSEKDLMWTQKTNDNFKDFTETPMSMTKEFSTYDKSQHKGSELTGGRDYVFKFRLLQRREEKNWFGFYMYNTIAHQDKTIWVDDNANTVTQGYTFSSLNNDFFELNNYNNLIRLNVSAYVGTELRGINYDVFNIDLNEDIDWPQNAINKQVKLNTLTFDAKYDPENVAGGNWFVGVDVHKPSIQIQNLKFSIEYKYDLLNTNNIDVQYGNAFLTKNQINQLAQKSESQQNEDLKKLFAEKPFLSYFDSSTNRYEMITNDSEQYFLNHLNLKKKNNDDYVIEATIDVTENILNRSKHYVKENIFEIPITIVEDFDESIDAITTKQLTFSEVTFHQLKDQNGISLLNNSSNFNDQENLANNPEKIKFSYQQFKDLINFIKNNPQEKLYFLLTTEASVKLNKGTKNLTILDPLTVDWSLLPTSFVNLMDNRNQIKDLDNLSLILDLGNLELNLRANKLNNINFYWLLKQEYDEYRNPNIELPVTKDIEEIKSSSFKTDGLYDALIKIGHELKALIDEQKALIAKENDAIRVENKSLATTKELKKLHPFLEFLDNLSFNSYYSLITETLNLNNEILWEINRNALDGSLKELVFANDESYSLQEFFAVVKQETEEEILLVNTIIDAIEVEDYFKMAKYIGDIDFNIPTNDFEKLAYAYLKTLRLYVNKNTVNGNMPRGQNFAFPNLDHVFMSNLPVNNTNYIIANEYIFNGSLLSVGQEETIAKVFGPEEQEELLATKEIITTYFIPPRVVQIFDVDGKEFSNKNSNDGEEIAILNAQNVANPKIINNYLAYENYPNLVLNKKSTIYKINLTDEDVTYYFADYNSALEFVRNYMMQFVTTIVKGGEYD